jgi:hypothetical protein
MEDGFGEDANESFAAPLVWRSVMAWSSAGRSHAIGLLSSTPESRLLNRLRLSDFGVSAASSVSN